MKTCKTCKHVRPAYWFVFGPKGRWKFANCARLVPNQKVDPVTGEPESMLGDCYCSVERMYEDRCGAEGKFWEQRKVTWFNRVI